MNGILPWLDSDSCNSSFRNLRIILSDLRFHNTLQGTWIAKMPTYFPLKIKCFLGGKLLR